MTISKKNLINFLIPLLLIALFLLALFVYKANEKRKAAEYQAEKERQEKVVEELNERINASENAKKTYIQGIAVWGDNYAAEAEDGSTFAQLLYEIIKSNISDNFDPYKDVDEATKINSGIEETYVLEIPVANFNAAGDDTVTLAGRIGGIPFIISEEMTIPGECVPVAIKFISKNEDTVDPLALTDAGMEYVLIDGVKGKLDSTSNGYTFTRLTEGTEQTVAAGTAILTAGNDVCKSYIQVLLTGSNGGYGSIEELVEQQNAMLAVNKNQPGRFIIISVPSDDVAKADEYDEIMEKTYAKRYINLRTYFADKAFADLGIEMTDADRKAVENGMIPERFFEADGKTFTAEANGLIAKLIYERMNELGYFYEIREATGLTPGEKPEDMPLPWATPEPTPTVTPEPTPMVTPEPTPTATPEPTPTVTPEPTPTATPEPTPTATPEPTPTATPEPTPTATPEPTPTATPEPTPTATPEPTPTPGLEEHESDGNTERILYGKAGKAVKVYASAESMDVIGSISADGITEILQEYSDGWYRIQYAQSENGYAFIKATETEPIYTGREIYVVQYGDTLWRVATITLGSGGRNKEILAANGMTSNTIYTGQVLIIP